MTKHRIMIADSSPTVRTFLRNEFDPKRFDVFEVADGREAVRVALEIKPTIATLSMVLPGCNGIEVCSAITSSELTARTTVVVITASDSEEDRCRAFDAGAVRFLCKGFPQGELAAYAEEIIRTRELLAETRVLVVDDNEYIRRTIARLLQSEGAVVFQAGDGEAGLAILAEHEVDIVLTDYHMPIMDGIQFVEALRAQQEHEATPVLFVSASEYRHTTVRALDAGANDFIRKPFEGTELLARLRSFARLANLTKQLQKRATTDELTGLLSRREAIARLDMLHTTARRYGTPFSCILIDIDHFKAVNDLYGHAAGDAVLRKIASAVRQSVREADFVCRVGGEEFLVLSQQTSLHDAAECGEKLRALIEAKVVRVDGNEIKRTISVGVAEYSDADTEADTILRAADEALYGAKHAGRNRVCLNRLGSLEFPDATLVPIGG